MATTAAMKVRRIDLFVILRLHGARRVTTDENEVRVRANLAICCRMAE